MKLYRGINSKEFSHFTNEISDRLSQTWEAILEDRARGNFAYPDDLNDEILAAEKLVRLQRQHFTDNKEIASSYARAKGGLLVEIDVPVADILELFTIEFQKFAQRRKGFELVYVVDAAKLSTHAKKWKLKTKPFDGGQNN